MITRRDFLKITAAGGALASIGQATEAKETIRQALKDPAFIEEGGRAIPVLAETDVVVVGGNSGAVSAAAAAARVGSRVFLIAAMPYLGDDICGAFRYQTDKKHEQAQTALARKIFLIENDIREEDYPAASDFELLYTQYKAPTPLRVKTELENELVDRGVSFLYSSYVTNVLIDASGGVAGVVIVNRSGRQAIRCKAVIDATTNALVAGLSGGAFTPFTSGKKQFEYTVVGNSEKSATGIIKAEPMPFTFTSGGKEYPVINYTFEYEMKDDSYASLMEAEQFIRDATWDADQVDSADLLWYIPGRQIIPENDCADRITSVASLGMEAFVPNVIKYHPDNIDAMPSVRALPMDVFICKGAGNVWVLGPSAAVPREVAAWLSRPINLMMMGEIMGEKVAEAISSKKIAGVVKVLQPVATATKWGEVREVLLPLRSGIDLGVVDSSAGALPVLGRYDVVVMGGGTAGAPAGVSASRQGAKTLVVDYLHGLGGITTMGFIGRYWDGFREGFTAEVDAGVRAMAPADHPRQFKTNADFRADWKMEWYRRELRQTGGKLWFGVIGCGALVRNGRVEGLVVATPQGRGVILSDLVIDSSGSADIAIAAGAAYEYTGRKTLAIQGAGLSRFDLNDYYNNTDWSLVDDTDILDVSRLYVQAKEKYADHYDLGKLPQTRERRRVKGEYTISVYDVINHRRYADTISYHMSSFDTHGMTVDPFFTLNPPGKRHVIYDADVPLRALLPAGLEGIIVTGLGASAHRDAMPVIRMQPCLQNQGYAVGYLAATATREGLSVRKVNLRKIQKHLVEKGVLPPRVLADKEAKEFSNKDFERASTTVAEGYAGLEVLLSDPVRCTLWMRKKMSSPATMEQKLVYASILCMLGDKEYAPILTDKIRSFADWDTGWHYTASAQFGECMSRLDSLIIALGNTRDASALPAILEKAELLSPEDPFSHFRAVTMACMAIGSREAIPVLHLLLVRAGMRHHDLPNYAACRREVVPYIHDVSYRNRIYKELHLAQALYLCGDCDGAGEEVLRRYASGLEGHYARFAHETLKG